MTQEEKELLLQDLCSRLPYHPIAHVEHDIIGGLIETADLQVYGYEGVLKLLREDNETFCYLPIEECKLYLRPMSSMTDEEEKEFNKVVYDSIDIDNISPCVCVANWLYSKCFDVNGLIPKDLAIEAPEGMYQ